MTFRDFVRANSLPEDVDSQWQLYDQQIWLRVRAILADPAISGDESLVIDILTDDIVTSFLGAAWIESKAADPGPSRSTAGKLHRAEVLRRRRDLARRLYQFQSFPWFEHYVRHVETNDLRSALFEGDVLTALMSLPGATVDRVRESGVKGHDHDIVVRIPGAGEPIPVEVKTKSEKTPYSASTVTRTLKAAARQLPPRSTGWVFLHIPFAWVGSRLENGYPDALHEGVRQTDRVAAVFSAVDKVHLTSGGSRASVTRVWHPFFAESARGKPIGRTSLDLYRLLETGADLTAPRPPF